MPSWDPTGKRRNRDLPAHKYSQFVSDMTDVAHHGSDHARGRATLLAKFLALVFVGLPVGLYLAGWILGW